MSFVKLLKSAFASFSALFLLSMRGALPSGEAPTGGYREGSSAEGMKR